MSNKIFFFPSWAINLEMMKDVIKAKYSWEFHQNQTGTEEEGDNECSFKGNRLTEDSTVWGTSWTMMGMMDRSATLLIMLLIKN